MHGHCHYDWVLSWSGAKQHSRRETPLLKSLIKSGVMHLAPAPDVKELSNFLLLERSGIQVCTYVWCDSASHKKA